MGEINRSLDSSERKRAYHSVHTGSVASSVHLLFEAPHACTLVRARALAVSPTLNPSLGLYLHRFVVGTGMATYAVATGLTLSGSMSLSGPQQFSLPASGNSLLNLQKGDLLVVTHSGASTPIIGLGLSVCVQATEEIKSWWGV